MTGCVDLLYYHYSDSLEYIPTMKRIRETTQETKNIPQNGPQLSVEERLKIIANLIVDRIIEKQKQNLVISEKL